MERANVAKEALMLALTVSHSTSFTAAAEEEARTLEYERELEKTERRCNCPWIRPWIHRQSTHGGEVFLQELALEDPSSCMNVLHMSTDTFDELLSMAQNAIQRQDTQM